MRRIFRIQNFWPVLYSLAVLTTACGPSIPVTGNPTAATQASVAPSASPFPAPSANISPVPTQTPAPPTEAPTVQPSATAAASPTFVPAQTRQGAALLQALRGGGYVIYFRHAATDQSQADTDPQHLENCQTQRNLTDAGWADARDIGEAFRRLEIPVGMVLSSGYCRTRETAQLAFGRAEVREDLTGFPTALAEQRVAALRQMLSTPPEAGTNTVLVAHGFNISNTANLSLSEGEAAIFAPRGEEGFTLIARLKPGEWAGLGK